MKKTSTSCLRRGNLGTSIVPILYLAVFPFDDDSALESDISSSEEYCLDLLRLADSPLGFNAMTVVPASCDIFNAVTNLMDPNE